ncbi:NUDIX hydrolase [Amaricoccus macauensis]|uniref:NUDIX hydrolase n=1 Tax=Amaricoccus macauensis TaxID=57001 RepID=UPI003C7A5491
MSAPTPDAGRGPAPVPLRDAATLILYRREAETFRVLMGQRGASAVFMPQKFVFPGGALDAGDGAILPDRPHDPETRARLEVETPPDVAHALPYTAVRELWEETGVLLGRAGAPPEGSVPPPGWAGFLATGQVPDVRALQFVFRAVTPPGRPRRFDARFFLLDAGEAGLDAEDFARADGELSHLQWLEIHEARRLPLPFITEIVLSELEARFAAPHRPRPVPFFDHRAEGSHFLML